ncbi:amino acid adenylation domain-containing protein [Streptomyces sp. NPDC051907]|uniref:amino acid adenylation domain-containing protein n=1 Tax=Streptomyces sp. NPDC051907 TaxID=3155284 RepID=UPI003448C710
MSAADTVDPAEQGPRLPFRRGGSPDGSRLRRQSRLDAAVWQRIADRARREGLDPAAVLGTAFTEALGLWASRSRFAIGVVTGGQGAVLPLSVDAAPRGGFLDRAARFAPGYAAAGQPAAPDVVFVDALGEAARPATAEGAAATAIAAAQLSLTVSVNDGALHGTWEAAACAALPDGLVEDLAESWLDLLAVLAEDPGAWSAPGSPVRLPAHQARTRAEVNDTAAPAPEGLLHEAVARAAALHPARPAVISRDRTLDYTELTSRARRIGRRLRELGAEPDALVALCMEKGWEQPVGVLGVLESGAAWVPIDPALPAERRAYLLGASGARIVLAQRSTAGQQEWPEGTTVLCVDDDAQWSGCDDAPLAPAQTADDLAYVIFTSGSTGLPKGAMIPHRSALNTLAEVVARYEVTCEDRFVALSSTSFDLSVAEIFGALTTGAALVVPEPGNERNPAHWLETVRRERVTVWATAPALFEMFCEHVERAPEPWAPSLRLMILGGDWIPLSLPGRARAIAPGSRFVSVGGNTEASIFSGVYEVPADGEVALVDGQPATGEAGDRTSIPYGTPVANQTLHVLDAELRPRPVWVPGDLYIGGAGVGRGYWGDPARTEAAFLSHPETGEPLYRTGDLARFLPDGNVEFLGREDFQVKVGGHRIELGEIEAALRSHPGVDAAVAIALPRQDGAPGNQGLAGYVSPASGAWPSAAELRAHLEARIPSYTIPPHLITLETLPLTVNGKVDRRALPRPGEQQWADEEFTAPRTALEEQIADLWSEVLGAERVGVHDTFFELGGNSLLGIRVMNRLRDRLRLQLDLHSIFQSNTVAALALAVERERASGGSGGSLGDELAVAADPAAAHEPFPLTELQQAYCMGRTGAFSSGNVSAHMYLEYEGEGLDTARFQRAWQRVVDRHPMLRAVMVPETMSQRVLPSVPPYEMRVVDLRGADEAAVEAGLAAVRAQHSHEVRPMDQWPLFEVVVAELDEDRSRVYFSVDSLCSDFASLRILFDDLALFYADPEAAPEPPALDYRDYILTTARLGESEQYRRSLAYWEERLPTLPPAPQLPMLRNPESVAEPRFVRRSARIPADRWKRLSELAGRAGLTPAGLLLSVYAEALTPWNQSPRFTLNVTNLNRLPIHPEVGSVVGEFASFSLLEVDNTRPEPFADRARRIQEQLWSDLSHWYVSGVQLLRELMRIRGGYDGAMMPVVFTSAVPLGSGPTTLLDGLLHPVDGITQTPQVWMDLMTEEQDGDLLVNWDVNEALFAPELLDEIFAAMRALLARLTDDESAWSRVEPQPLPPRLTTAGEDFGDGGRRELPDRLVHDFFLDQVAQRPEQPAVIASGRTLSYAQLHHEACRLAHRLRSLGAGPDRPVGIVLAKGWEQVVAAYAVLYAGAPYLPIDPEAPDGRVRELLARCGVELVLTRPELAAKAAGCRLLYVAPDDGAEDRAPEPAEPPAPAAKPSDLAYVLFTSGSSGTPKGAMIEHRSVVNSLRETIETFAIAPGDRCLALTALHHDMSVFDLFGVLGAGGVLVVPDAAERREAAHWARLMAAHEVTVWNSVPAMMEMLLEHLGEDSGPLDALRLAFLGGDWIPLPVARRLCEREDVELVSVGGPTETTLWNIWHRVTRLDPARRSVPYGRPIANTRYFVLDERMRDRPVWATGEMYCSGVGLARGYWGDPERTEAAFAVHPRTGERLYRTGDLGRFLPDGTIEFVGRADFQLKVHGQRIEPGEVEAALTAHPAVAAAVVAGQRRAGRMGHRALTGYVVPARGRASTDGDTGRSTDGDEDTGRLRDALRAHLRDLLPAYMVPTALVFLDALPLNANGKVDRLALPAPQPGPEESAGPSPAPLTPVEEIVAGVWAEVLESDAVGAHDNFFALGGDSVLATRIVTRLRRILDSEAVSLRTLFLSPTVAELAASMIAAESVPGRTAAVADIHLKIARMDAGDVARELSARRRAADEDGVPA